MKKTGINKISLKVLYLEDSPHDAEIIRELLIDAGYNLSMDCVEKEKEYVSLLRERTYDLILSDFTLPGFDAFGALQLAIDISPDVPFICISGSIGEETAIKLIKQGAVDYILKDRIARLPLAILRTLDEVKERKSRQQIEKNLRASEERYRLLFNSSMDGILLTSPAGEIFSANPAACKMFNRSEEEICLLGRKCIVDASDPRLAPALEDRAKTGRFSGELTLLRKDGTKFPAEVSTVLFKDKKGAGRSSMVIRDIAERKRAEEALRMSEAKLSNAVKMAHLAHWEYDVDNDLFTFNDHFYALYRTTVEQVGGYTMSLAQYAQRFVHPDDIPVIDTETRKARESTDPHYSNQVEHRIIYSDGETGYITVRIFVVKDDQGRTIKTYGVNQDITERKRAEEAIRESEEKFRMVFENVFDGVSIHVEDPDPMKRTLIECNERYAAMAGRSREELLRRGNIQNLLITLEDKANIERLESLSKGTAYRGSFSWIRPDGKENTVEYVGVPVTWRGKSYSIGIDRDVTERKQAVEALRRSKERYRLLYEHAPVGILLANRSGQILEINPAALQILGSPSVEETKRINLLTFQLLVNAGISAAFQRCIETGQADFGEYAYVSKWGRPVQMQLQCVPILDDQHQAAMVHIIIEDVTERRQVEEALQKSEELYRTVFENTGTAIMLIEENTVISLANAELEKLWQYSKQEIEGKKSWTEFVVKEDLDRMLKQHFLRRVNREAALNQYEFGFVSRDGNIHNVVITIDVIPGTKRSVASLLDISERKRAEEALRNERLLLRIIIDHLPDAIYTKDMSCKKTLANIADVRALGAASEAELLGKDDFAFFPKKLAEALFADDQSVLQTGRPLLNKEEYLLNEKGEKSWLLTSKLPLRDNKGQMIGLIGIDHDITERKHAEELLQASEAQYRSLFENANEAIYIIEPFTEKILEANSRAWEMYGFAKEEFIGMSLKALTKDVIRGESIISETLQTLRLKDFETTHIKNDGTLLNLLVNASVMNYKEQPAILCISRDITERIQAEERRQKLERDFFQAQRIESIGELASGIAHDFNNILNIMLGNTSVLLQSDLDPQKVKKGLDTITRSINRGMALVRQILTFARKTDVEYGVVDINASIKEIAQMMSETFPKNISLSLHLKEEIPSIILDGDQFHQAVLNLCINARDAMPKGGVLRITTGMQSGSSLRIAYPEATEDSYIYVTVADTGTGISEEIRRHIFEPFFTTKEREKGTGLGLAVVYGIVRSHQGFIDLESEVGKGSTFFIYLPAKEVRRQEGKPNEAIEEESLEGDETILVVEDEEDMLELLAEVFEANGYHVLSAKDGEEAIKLSRQNENQIDVVLCDVQLPKISGRETCRQIKQLNPDVKIIFASGFLDSAVKKDLVEAGASDFVQKPCSPVFIIKKIRKVLAQA